MLGISSDNIIKMKAIRKTSHMSYNKSQKMFLPFSEKKNGCTIFGNISSLVWLVVVDFFDPVPR